MTFIEAEKVLIHKAQNTSGHISAVPDAVAAIQGDAISQPKGKP